MADIFSIKLRKCLSDTDCTNGEKCVQKNKICSTIVEIERCEKEHFTIPCKSNNDCQVWAHEKICNKGCCWDLL
uniref:Carboxypeptidase A inhibitor n=1 Tax=Ascaris suum TaxID=6253 RepID=F1LHE8_ASCSU